MSIYEILPALDLTQYASECTGLGRYDNVTLSPLLLQLGLRFGSIQRNGAAPGVIHTGRFFCPNSVEVVGKINARG